MDAPRPFKEHPYLVSLLLGRDFIKSNKHFAYVLEATEGMRDYHQLKESILLQLSRPKARFELVATSRSLRDVLSVSLNRLADQVRAQSVFVQVGQQL